ncbi:MAG: hypothetical protein N2035_01620 [Chthoniobacterales bacterium]|nr:hypothetical protein [Chthoniobacterales bacterium]
MSPFARFIAYLNPSYSCQRILDVSNLYGQAVPLMTNRTKIPVFLTPGEKETIEWKITGIGSFRENYDKISPVNTSWQNLLAIPTALGQYRNEFVTLQTDTGSVRRLYLDSLEVRKDVLYRKVGIYRSLAPVARSLLALGGWFISLYALTFIALAVRKASGGD